MSKELIGVSLSRFEDPIQTALATYEETSNGLVFDRTNASKLELTPDKPNSARSSTDVLFRREGELIGKLYVIAFKPGDGTGSQDFYKLEDLIVAPSYPREVKIVPRKKTGVYSEVHLAIAGHDIENVHADPSLYEGSLDLVGLIDKKVQKIGQLGHLRQGNFLPPIATFTVGYKDAKRFGDPHSVYNPSLALQVCAFLAVSDEVHKKHPDVLEGLNVQFPA